MYRVLRNRAILTLGIAETISNLGNWITMLAIFAIIVFRGNGTTLQSGSIMLAGLGPMLIASPIAGWLTDRRDRKWLMISSHLLSAACIIGLITTESLPFIYACLSLQAVAGAIMLPARQAAVRQLVPDDELTQANAVLQQLSGLIKIGGPILAGALLTVLTPHQAMLIDVVSFVIAALLLTTLPTLPPQSAPIAAATPGSPAPAVGIRDIVLRGAQLRLLFSATFFLILVILGFDVLSAIVTRDVLLGDESLFGLLIGSIGLGTVLAAGWLLLRSRARDVWRDVLIGLALFTAIPLSLALATSIDALEVARNLTMIGCLLGGFGNGLVNIQASTLLQRLSPPELLGRIGGLFQMTIVAGQLLAIIITPLLVPGLLSIRVYFSIAAVSLMALTIWTAITLRSVRRNGSHTEQPWTPQPS